LFDLSVLALQLLGRSRYAGGSVFVCHGLANDCDAHRLIAEIGKSNLSRNTAKAHSEALKSCRTENNHPPYLWLDSILTEDRPDGGFGDVSGTVTEPALSVCPWQGVPIAAPEAPAPIA